MSMIAVSVFGDHRSRHGICDINRVSAVIL